MLQLYLSCVFVVEGKHISHCLSAHMPQGPCGGVESCALMTPRGTALPSAINTLQVEWYISKTHWLKAAVSQLSVINSLLYTIDSLCLRVSAGCLLSVVLKLETFQLNAFRDLFTPDLMWSNFKTCSCLHLAFECAPIEDGYHSHLLL